MKFFPTILVLIFFFTLPTQAREIAGIEMPESIEPGGTELTLNGAGVRKKMFMNIYAGGLYLQSEAKQVTDIVTADQPMAIRLHMVSGLVSSEAMEEATREGYDSATGGNIGPLSEYIEEFIGIFSDPIAENDVFEMVFIPGKGLSVFKNSVYLKTVDGGLPFKQATFAIWLGEKPADKGLKREMLKR